MIYVYNLKHTVWTCVSGEVWKLGEGVDWTSNLQVSGQPDVWPDRSCIQPGPCRPMVWNGAVVTSWPLKRLKRTCFGRSPTRGRCGSGYLRVGRSVLSAELAVAVCGVENLPGVSVQPGWGEHQASLQQRSQTGGLVRQRDWQLTVASDQIWEM